MDRILTFFTAGQPTKQVKTLLKGIPACSGIVTARARVVLDREDYDQLQTGEILVTHSISPSWMLIFPKVSAIVTDVGGPLSNACKIARAYGFPVVVGTMFATQRICTGQVICVDGGAGIITILE